MFNWISMGLAMSAFVFGLVGAWRWYQASLVKTDPDWSPHGGPVDPTQSLSELLLSNLEASAKAAELNRRAAVATAVAALLSAASTLSAAFT
jgi:hypothetical protein